MRVHVHILVHIHVHVDHLDSGRRSDISLQVPHGHGKTGARSLEQTETGRRKKIMRAVLPVHTAAPLHSCVWWALRRRLTFHNPHFTSFFCFLTSLVLLFTRSRRSKHFDLHSRRQQRPRSNILSQSSILYLHFYKTQSESAAARTHSTNPQWVVDLALGQPGVACQ